MMKRLSLLILLLPAVLFVQAQNSWITVYDQATFDLPGKTAVDTICIPVRLEKGVSFKDVKLAEHPSLVRLNGQSRQIYIDALRLSKSDAPMPVLRLVVNLRLLAESGAYVAIFSLSSKTGTVKHPRVDLSLTLNRLAVKLDTIRRITIHIDGSHIQYDPFMVRETGKQCDIQSLYFTAPFLSGIKDSNFLRFLPMTGTIPAGTVFTIPYDLSPEYAEHTGKLPLGTNSGWVEVSVPGLGNTLVVPIDIINKRDKCWILLMTFLGILAGALVRTFLNNRRLAEDSRVKGYQLIQQMRNETKYVTDEPFQTRIDTLITDLKGELQTGSTQAGIDAQIAATINAYNTARKDFETKLAGDTSDLKRLFACVANDMLSSFILRLFDPVRILVGESRDALQKLDPTTAEAKTGAVIAGMNKLIIQYSTNTASLISDLTNKAFYPVPPFSTTIITTATTTATKIQGLVQSVKSTIGSANDVADAISQLDAAQSTLENLLTYLQDTADTAFNSVVGTGPASSQLTALHTAFDAWSARLAQLIADPYQTMNPTLIQNLVTAWAAIQSPTPSLRTTRGAAAAVVTAAAATGPADLLLMPRSTLAGDVSLSSTASGMATIEGLASRSRKRLLQWTIFQILALSLVFCLVFYKTNGPNFVGTTDELINLFLIGFSIDVTVDGLMKLIGKG
jgi:DNA-binding FrmR family transcriptional regulator